MANYAYNIINEQPTDSIFLNERTALDKSFKKENEIQYPDDSQVLTANARNDEIIGTYHNKENWPIIKIYKEGDPYIFNWGVLKGKIFRNDEGGYRSNLGVLSRNFQIKKDSLLTGSLMYKK